MGNEPLTLEEQMATFLKAMGFRRDHQIMAWRLTDTQVWSDEELRRMWLAAHGRVIR